MPEPTKTAINKSVAAVEETAASVPILKGVLKLSDESGDVTKEGNKLSSLFEKLVDLRFLVLLITFFLYLDIWLLRSGVDPTTFALASGYEAVKKVPIFTAVIFILSYSLLMGGFFPALRKINRAVQVNFRTSQINFTNETLEDKRLSDWSIAFIVLSIYDAVIGYFFVETSYKGLAVFVLNVLQTDGFEVAIFRLCIFFLWFACLSLAVEVDRG